MEKVGIELLKELLKEVKSKKREKIIWQITRTTKLTSREKSRLALLKLACQIKQSQKPGRKPDIKMHQEELSKLVKRFAHLPTYLLNIKLYTRSDIWQEIKYFLSKNPCQEKKKELNFLRQQKKERQEILRGLEAKIRRIADVLSYDVWLRDERIMWFGNPAALVHPLFREAAKRQGVSYKEFVQQRIFEIEAGGVSRQELRKRLKGYIYIVKNGIVKVLDLTKEKTVPYRQKIIKGQISNTGKVKGRVRIGTAYSFHKLKQGEIVVTGMTTPEAVSFLRRAAAFVTDEGGITCHAAILSRELNKPCIIGIKIATKVLKDGDLVEVDADKGVVRKLK